MTAHYPRPVIVDRIPRDRHTVIKASTSTGKTFTIEHLVIDLLVDGEVPLEKILVLTFTERTATELRRRIRSKIEEILANSCRDINCRAEQPTGLWWIDAE